MNRANSATGWVRNPVGTLGWTWNPITGCLNGCEYCYARKLANGRLKPLYLANNNLAPLIGDGVTPYHTARMLDAIDPFYPRFWEERLSDARRGYHRADFVDGNVPSAAKPRGIFTCDMSDLFGIGIPKEWTKRVFSVIKEWDNRFDRFYLLTQQPHNLINFSPFPPSCWVGVTATNDAAYMAALKGLGEIQAKVKYLSFEPLLEEVINQSKHHGFCNLLSYYLINWVIIGACTGRKAEILELCQRYPDLTPMPYGKIWTAQPKIEWVEEIVQACDKAGVAVFLKDNLAPLLNPMNLAELGQSIATYYTTDLRLRQEMLVK